MRILLVVPVLIILVAFALSNRQVVQLGLWPTDILIDAPLSVTILVAAGLFFIIGALMTWGAGVLTASRARQAERTVRQLEAEVRALKAQPRGAQSRSVQSRSVQPGSVQPGSVQPGSVQPRSIGNAMALPPPGA